MKIKPTATWVLICTHMTVTFCLNAQKLMCSVKYFKDKKYGVHRVCQLVHLEARVAAILQSITLSG